MQTIINLEIISINVFQSFFGSKRCQLLLSFLNNNYDNKKRQIDKYFLSNSGNIDKIILKTRYFTKTKNGKFLTKKNTTTASINEISIVKEGSRKKI